MNQAVKGGGAICGVIFAFGAAAAASDQYFGSALLTKLFGTAPPSGRVGSAADTAGAVSGIMAANADEAMIDAKKKSYDGQIKAELANHPGSVYVIEVIAPASGLDAPQPLANGSIALIGIGQDIYHALASNNIVRAGHRVPAIDQLRSKFLVGSLNARGEIDWREAPRPAEDVVAEKVKTAAISIAAQSAPTPQAQPKAPPREREGGAGSLGRDAREARGSSAGGNGNDSSGSKSGGKDTGSVEGIGRRDGRSRGKESIEGIGPIGPSGRDN